MIHYEETRRPVNMQIVERFLQDIENGKVGAYCMVCLRNPRDNRRYWEPLMMTAATMPQLLNAIERQGMYAGFATLRAPLGEQLDGSNAVGEGSRWAGTVFEQSQTPWTMIANAGNHELFMQGEAAFFADLITMMNVGDE